VRAGELLAAALQITGIEMARDDVEGAEVLEPVLKLAPGVLPGEGKDSASNVPWLARHSLGGDWSSMEGMQCRECGNEAERDGGGEREKAEDANGQARCRRE